MLLERRVHLDLVHRGHDVALGGQLLQVLREEVGDADRADEALGVQRLEGLPGLDVQAVLRVGPVDQVEVHRVDAELAPAVLEGAAGAVRALVAVAELRGDEELLARDARRLDGGAHALLVVVAGGGVDVAIAGLERALHGLLRLGGRGLEDAEAQLRDGDAVVQGDEGDAMCSRLLRLDGHGVRRRRGARPTAASHRTPGPTPCRPSGTALRGGRTAVRRTDLRPAARPPPGRRTGAALSRGAAPVVVEPVERVSGRRSPARSPPRRGRSCRCPRSRPRSSPGSPWSSG
ncbi:hypothetical protein CMMCA002_09085 [Clavibacter michiganensis subsp. michiganensis]|nr:hypothetical protein CMMCA002_09085 [Clavibacter michiganensis subsp. michiganensis]